MAGRFAPSPTGALHLGNLRTALVAWLVARARGRRFVVRMEDLDPVVASRDHERSQLRDLAAVGIEWDGDVWRQSERVAEYGAALASLTEQGLTYECFCSRREIRDAAAAPHGAELVYPGTCRDLSGSEQARRREHRSPAIRFRADGAPIVVDDLVAGGHEGLPGDVVLRRNDGTMAYHLAVVVDDAAQGIDHVVRGADLLSATPSQVALQRALGVPTPEYLHVPLVVGPTGERLAKRDGAVTLDDLAARGVGAADVRDALLATIERTADGSVDLARMRSRGNAPIAVGTLGLPT